MKSKTLIAATLVTVMSMASCQRDESELTANNENPVVETISNVDAQESFAKILSKAVANSEDVRNFIKDEAIAQFDNDYDVFYPFVKDKEVSDGKTFRDILLSYCESDEELVQIEESALLLNILVPDLTMFWDFCAETWDTTSGDVAVISKDDKDNTMYTDGQSEGSLPPEVIPGFPCLVVKNNERLVVRNGATRAGDAVYEFVSDAFDASKNKPQTRKVNEQEWDVDLQTVSSSKLSLWSYSFDPAVITGWKEFGTDPTKAQRDYAYYGMTSTQPQGKLKINYSEEIIAFRLNPAKFKYIADDSEDPGFKHNIDNLSNEYKWFTDAHNLNDFLGSASPGKGHGERDAEWILGQLWKDGNFEINVKAYIANTGAPEGSALTIAQYSVPARKAFSVDKARLHRWHGTWFNKQLNVYTISLSDLGSNWIRPSSLPDDSETHVFTQPWDLTNTSTTLYLFFSEFDKVGTKNITYGVTNKWANSSSFTGGDDSYKTSYGTSNETSSNSQISISTTEGSDDMGVIMLNYRDPVLKSVSYNVICEPYVINNGFLEVALAPRARY